jgi:hypothetical protein
MRNLRGVLLFLIIVSLYEGFLLLLSRSILQLNWLPTAIIMIVGTAILWIIIAIINYQFNFVRRPRVTVNIVDQISIVIPYREKVEGKGDTPIYVVHSSHGTGIDNLNNIWDVNLTIHISAKAIGALKNLKTTTDGHGAVLTYGGIDTDFYLRSSYDSGRHIYQGNAFALLAGNYWYIQFKASRRVNIADVIPKT